MSTYSTIKQRQPLRVPNTFKDQEKQLVIQLEGLFDDIYKHFGRLGMDDMSKGFRFVIDNKYDIVSGITIDEDGVEVKGNKYVKINSGGTFEVDSTNFVVSSTYEYIRIGKTRLSQAGLVFTNNDNTTVRLLRPGYIISDTDVAGMHIRATEVSGQIIQYETELISRKGIPGDLPYPTKDLGTVIFGYLQNPNAYEPADTYAFYAENVDGVPTILGRKFKPWEQGHIKNIFTDYLEMNGLNIEANSYGSYIDVQDRVGVHLKLEASVTYKWQRLVSSGYLNSSYDYVADEVEIIFRGSDGVVKLRGNLTGNVTGNVTGDVTGNLSGNIINNTSELKIYPLGANKSYCKVGYYIENGDSTVYLTSDADSFEFRGNADTATKLSRAPLYGELSGRL